MKQNSQINIVDEIKAGVTSWMWLAELFLLKGGKQLQGNLPVPQRKTPSFVVSETKQIYTCFGCGATGDVINFVERYYALDFKGAVEMLAKEYGISLEGAFRGGKDKDEYYEINRQAARFFSKL